MRMRRRFLRVAAVATSAALLATACTSDGGSEDTTTGTEDTTDGGTDGGQAGGGSVLDEVLDRGTFVCGVNGTVPGFSFVDDEGTWSGFDVEFCKAVAIAVLGDSEAVEYRALNASERFTALQGRQIDALIRNTTWTATRDGSEGAAFAITTFYDGQGIMVRADSGIESIEDMDNTIVCVQSGTTTELNLATVSETRGVAIEPLTFEDNEAAIAAFEGEQCEGFTSDKSQLAGLRSNFSEGPEALVILDETVSKEPLGPAVRDNDTPWYDVVNWVSIALILAEELGIDSTNVEDLAANSDDPDIQRFLGAPVEGGDPFDPGIRGLEPGWVVDVVSELGNYGEIYDRTVGPDTPLGLSRGLNDLYTNGGILYAPPYR